MHNSYPAPRVKYHTSETVVWSEVITSNIEFEIWNDRTTLLVFPEADTMYIGKP